MPLEIVHGETDIVVPPMAHSLPLSRLAPGANLVLLPGVGHMPHHAALEAVIAAIDRARARAGHKQGGHSGPGNDDGNERRAGETVADQALAAAVTAQEHRKSEPKSAARLAEGQ